MPTTSPDNIYYPDSTTSAAFETAIAQLAGSVQDAFDGSREDRQLQTFDWADASERNSQTGMTEGAIGYQRDTDVYYTYDGVDWNLLVQQGPYSIAVPSAVTGGSVDSNGIITSSSVAAVRPKGVFTSAFRRYEVKFDITTASSTTVNVRLAVGDTDTSSGYDNQRHTDVSGTAAAAQSLNLAVLLLNGGVASTRHVGSLFFDSNPNAAAATYFRVDTTVSPNPMTTAHGRYVGAGLQRGTTQFDGLSFIADTGNLTMNYCSVVGSI